MFFIMVGNLRKRMRGEIFFLDLLNLRDRKGYGGIGKVGFSGEVSW